MAWASSGGYPGVVSDGAGGLELDAIVLHNVLALQAHCAFFLTTASLANLLFIQEGHHNDGLAVLHGVGLFGHEPPSTATVGGNHTAGGTYTAVEQAMLEAVYTALQSIGLVT